MDEIHKITSRKLEQNKNKMKKRKRKRKTGKRIFERARQKKRKKKRIKKSDTYNHCILHPESKLIKSQVTKKEKNDLKKIVETFNYNKYEIDIS